MMASVQVQVNLAVADLCISCWQDNNNRKGERTYEQQERSQRRAHRIMVALSVLPQETQEEGNENQKDTLPALIRVTKARALFALAGKCRSWRRVFLSCGGQWWSRMNLWGYTTIVAGDVSTTSKCDHREVGKAQWRNQWTRSHGPPLFSNLCLRMMEPVSHQQGWSDEDLGVTFRFHPHFAAVLCCSS